MNSKDLVDMVIKSIFEEILKTLSILNTKAKSDESMNDDDQLLNNLDGEPIVIDSGKYFIFIILVIISC